MTSPPPASPPPPDRPEPAVPASELAKVVVAAAGAPTPFRTQVLTLMADGRGRTFSAEEFARRLGFKHRRALGHALRAAALPPFKTLAQLVTVVDWALTAECTGQSLNALAQDTGEHATHWYRTMREMTGHPWRELFEQGRSTAVIAAVATEFRTYRQEGPSALAC